MTISTTGEGEAHGLLSFRWNLWTHVAILRPDVGGDVYSVWSEPDALCSPGGIWAGSRPS